MATLMKSICNFSIGSDPLCGEVLSFLKHIPNEIVGVYRIPKAEIWKQISIDFIKRRRWRQLLDAFPKIVVSGIKRQGKIAMENLLPPALRNLWKTFSGSLRNNNTYMGKYKETAKGQEGHRRCGSCKVALSASPKEKWQKLNRPSVSFSVYQ